MIWITEAASLTVVAKQVRQSREAHAGTTPVVLTLPTVAFSPTQPFSPAGIRPEEEEEGEIVNKLQPANRTDHLCQLHGNDVIFSCSLISLGLRAYT